MCGQSCVETPQGRRVFTRDMLYMQRGRKRRCEQKITSYGKITSSRLLKVLTSLISKAQKSFLEMIEVLMLSWTRTPQTKQTNLSVDKQFIEGRNRLV